MLEEQVEIVHREWRESDLTFEGEHYRLRDLDALPKPVSLPNLIIGGRARRRSVALAVRWADEYNSCRWASTRSGSAAGRWRRRESRPRPAHDLADDGLADRGRRRRTWPIARAAWPSFDARTPGTSPRTSRAARKLDRGHLEEVREQLADLEEAGVERVMFQHLLHRDLDGVALIGELAAS